jgi:hypothetical protein
MTTSSPNDVSDRIVGLPLRCGKQGWTLDGERIEDGPQGFRVTVIATTAKWGRLQWVDRRVTDRVLHLYSDGFPPDWEEIPVGWDAYTGFQGIGADGDLLTFTGGGFGARRTVENLITQYQFRGRRHFPICTLASKPRGDAYNNVDPILRVVAGPDGWVSVDKFADMLPPELLIAAPRQALLPEPEAPTAPELPPPNDAPPIDENDGNLARAIDDDTPF